jgi:signal transduction histidine kinase
MGIIDKAKEIGDRVNQSVTAFSSDEVIANAVIKAVEKQEKVNAILKEKGSKYRVSDIDLGMGIPPSVTFGVRRVDEQN